MLDNFLKKLSLEDQRIPLNIQVPDDFYQTLLEELLERSYLSNTSEMRFVNLYANGPDYRKKSRLRIHWLQMTRLPVHPNDNESYDLLSRWQGVLTSLHAWGYRLYFLLLRYDGQTKLFIGAGTTTQDISAEQAVEELREAAFGSIHHLQTYSIRNIATLLGCSEEYSCDDRGTCKGRLRSMGFGNEQGLATREAIQGLYTRC